MPSTSLPLDFIPTSLIKSCSGVFAQVIARLANLSFEHSTFPVKFKTALVTLLLKKHCLDVSNPANYRPNSNLNTISKILERLVLVRIVPRQPALMWSSQRTEDSIRPRQHCSKSLMTSSPVSMTTIQSTILVALDQSAAFDCVDHKTLISRLDNTYGVTGSALDWIRSYLDARSTFVRWKQNSSDVFSLDTGVPQG